MAASYCNATNRPKRCPNCGVNHWRTEPYCWRCQDIAARAATVVARLAKRRAPGR